MAIRLEFKSNSRQARQDLSQLDRSVKNIDQNVVKASKGMSALASAAKIAGAAFAGIFATKQLAGVVDSVTLIENRIALVTGRTKELNTTFLELQQISLRSRGSLEGIADLYNRLGRTTKSLGVTNKEVLKVTETIQKAITISGASAQSADAAIVQLGQGLAAGALRGQELNSVMEQTPRVASAIAAELGVGVGQLRKLAEQGKITSEVVVAAFQNQADVIQAEFEAVDATVGQGFQQVAANAKLITREFIAGTGATSSLANKLLDIAASLQSVAPNARAAGESFTAFFNGTANADSGLSNIVDSLAELANTGVGYIADLGQSIVRFSGSVLDSALSKVTDFVEGVNEGFFWVYDQVVGNSWWPDLIDEVVAYTDKIFGALYKTEDFTEMVSQAFKRALSTVSAFASGLSTAISEATGAAFSVAISAKALNLTSIQGTMATIGIVFVEQINEGLDYLRKEFPTAFAVASSVALNAFVGKFGTIWSKVALGLGTALSTGIDPDEILASLEGVIKVLFTGLGRAIVTLIAAIPAALAALPALLYDAASSFGTAMLDQLGIIGDAFQLIPTQLVDAILGYKALTLLGPSIARVIFGKEFVAAAATGFGSLFDKLAGSKYLGIFANTLIPDVSKLTGLVDKAKVAFSGLFATGTITSKLGGAGATVKDLASSFGVLTHAMGLFGKGQLSFSSLMSTLTSTAEASVVAFGALWTSITSVSVATLKNTGTWALNTATLIANKVATYAVATGQAVLTSALVATRTAMLLITGVARGMWIAISGPLMPVIIGITLLVSLFKSMKANAESVKEVGKETEITLGKLGGFARAWAQLTSDGSNELELYVTVNKTSVEDTAEFIRKRNFETMVDVRQAINDQNPWTSAGYWFSGITRMGVHLDRTIAKAANSIANFMGRVLNDTAARINKFFGTDLVEDYFSEASIDPIDEYLSRVHPELFITLVPEGDLDFVDPADLAEFQSLILTIDNFRAKIKELRETGNPFDSIKADNLSKTLRLQELSLENLKERVPETIRLNKATATYLAQYKNLQASLKHTNGLFGEQVIQNKSLLEFASMNTAEYNQWLDLHAQVAQIQGEIASISANLLIPEAKKRDLIAAQMALLARSTEEMEDFGKTSEKALLLASAVGFGIDQVQALKLTTDELKSLRDVQQEINDLTFEKSKLAADDVAGKDDLDRQIAFAELKGRNLADDLGQLMTSVFDKTVTAFGDSGIAVGLNELANLGEKEQQILIARANKLAELDAAVTLAREKGTDEAVKVAQKAHAEGAKRIGKEVTEILTAASKNIFDRVLSPFRDIGATFGSEDFTKLGTQATADAFAKAEKLQTDYNAMINDTTKRTKEEEFKIVADFNRRLYEFEQETARKRLDALKNETDAKAFAQGFTDVITGALRDGDSFADGFVTLLLDNMTNSLNEQIASFAQGFIETLLGGMDSAEGAGGQAAGFLKTLFFGPTEEEKEGNRIAGAETGVDVLGAAKGLFGGGEEGASNEKGGSAGAKTGFGGVIDSVKTLGSTLLTEGFGGLGDLFGGLMNSLTQGLGSLFGGGGGAGGMLSTVMGFFGGMSDNGGSIASNKFNLVGERGPELISGPAKVYSRAKTAREMERSGGGGGNVTFALEGDFDSRAERSIRSMVQSGTLQSAMNGAEIENGGSRPVFRTP